MNEVGVWSICGMILTGNDSVLKEKPAQCHSVHQKSHKYFYYRVINTLCFGTKWSSRRLMWGTMAAFVWIVRRKPLKAYQDNQRLGQNWKRGTFRIQVQRIVTLGIFFCRFPDHRTRSFPEASDNKQLLKTAVIKTIINPSPKQATLP
jgi:hypothetical protein